MLSIGVDIGGTKIAAGVVDEDGEIVATTTRSTPATDPELLEAAVADAVAELRGAHQVSGIGVGAATRSPSGSSPSPACPSSSRTTRTPRAGPSTASGPPPTRATCSC
jgi:predicted NBD/HSP70 family sugar kinase